MFLYPKQFEVIVVGAGHAGIEAALAAARMGCRTLLLSCNLDTIGQMSCNPAIGGLAKGHLVREIDALGGEMGKAADMTGLQFRMLNAKKGPAVVAPRAQCDKRAYQMRMKLVCEREPNLDIKQGKASRLLCKGHRVHGVETKLGVTYLGTTVVITTGTFLRGLMHIGSETQAGGRAGEESSSFSDSLTEIGLEMGRLKTGTPPRLLRRTIDFSATTEQQGDDPVPYFSHWKDDLFHVERSCVKRQSNKGRKSDYPSGSILEKLDGQMSCFITHTTPTTIDIIKKNIQKSPVYSGAIEGVGPRYCPSIEDKIVKFRYKDRHQIFLEPEGVLTDEVYINGLSTCLPFEVQVDLVKSVIGCEHAEIMRPAYAVEYDFANPTQLSQSLETKVCQNLFLAGQINGTSGYEEAGAQGIMAGINAAMRVRGSNPVILGRDQAYIGVLIDDLVTKGTTEPYRMFTSRAEHRLTLRQDNADLRLSEIGRQIGLLPLHNYRTFLRKRDGIQREMSRLEKTTLGSISLAHVLRRPGIRYRDLPGSKADLSDDVIQQVEISVKYAGYIDRQKMEVEKLKTFEDKKIPDWLDYDLIPSLRTEARQKLSKIRPETLGQASRISGVSPVDVSLVIICMKRGPEDNHEVTQHRKCSE